MFSFLAGVAVWFATVTAFVFWPIVFLLTFFSIVCLEDDPAWGWWTTWTAPLALFIYLRYSPTVVNILLSAGLYILLGVIYSVWMWFKECRVLRSCINEAVRDITSWPSRVDVAKCALNGPYRDGSTGTYDSFAELLKRKTPQFSNHRQLVTFWIFMWLPLALRDLTIDLVKNILDLLKGIYQSIANNQFQA